MKKIVVSSQRAMYMVVTLNSFENAPFPAAVSGAFMRNRRILIAELEGYDAARRAEIEKYAEKDENGAVVRDEQGNATINDLESVERIQALDNTLVELEIHTVSLDLLNNFVISMKTLDILEPLFT